MTPPHDLLRVALRIGRRTIGDGEPCFVIAEVGINHGGSRDVALRLIDAAVAAGADAVKFQKRSLADTYRRDIVADPRQAEQGVQYLVPLLAEVELSNADYRVLQAHAAAAGVEFLCTPWDLPSVDFLETLDLAAYKVGSPDLTNFSLLERVATIGRPLIVSTGMSSEDEIRRSIALLESLEADFALMHCVSTYPAIADEVNLRFMATLREWSGRLVGYSGHELGTAISCAAVAMGACILERHITLDRSARGPDHKASLEPHEFRTLVASVREIESALGAPRRWMTRGELLNRRLLAKSLVAARDLPADTPLDRAAVASKGPGLGLSPQEVGRLLGRTTSRAMRADEPFRQSDLRDGGDGTHDTDQIDVGAPWGVVARFTDVAPITARFAPLGMRFIEFHVSDRDLDKGPAELGDATFPFGFAVHAPEYRHDALVDLCAADDRQRTASVATVQRAVDLARALTPRFTLDPNLFPAGPRVVVHAGGMDPGHISYDLAAAIARLVHSIRSLDASGVELLLENLPPYPWYFGGRWHGYVMCDAANVAMACRETGVGLCFDTSHAALACAAANTSLADFADRVRPLIRHLHVSDAAGVSGEGLQIGDGATNFADLMPRIVRPGVTLVPEVWMGHHDDGEGFRVALRHLTDLRWAGDAVGRAPDPASRGTLASLVVADSATIFGALRVIDANRMGIAFIVDVERRVVGVVTDGDIRHAFVRGLGLHTPVRDVMTRDFVHGAPGMTRDELRARLPGRTRVMPIIDESRRLVNVANLWTVGDAGP